MALTYTYPCNANSNSWSGLVWLRALLGFPRCAAIKSWVWVAACSCACCLQAKHGEKKVGFGPELTGKSGGVAVCACAAGCHPPTAGWIGQVSQVPSPSHLGLAGRGRTPDREGLKTFFFQRKKLTARKDVLCFPSPFCRGGLL